MRPISTTQTLFAAVALLLVGCTSRQPSAPRPPSPMDRPSEVVEKPVDGRNDQGRRKFEWSFRYSPNTYYYSISTTPLLAQFPDTSKFRTLTTSYDTVSIAVTDIGTSVVTPALPESLKCDETNALIIRARELIPSIPTNIKTGTTWTDSTTTEGCRGSIPTVSTVIRVYRVIGDTLFNQNPALLIQRTESISAKGEGNDGQHRVLMTAVGTGTGDLYFDVLAGTFVGMTGTQTTELSITASGRVSKFLQRLEQTVRLLP